MTRATLAGTPSEVGTPLDGVAVGARTRWILPLFTTKFGAQLGLEPVGALGYHISLQDVGPGAGLFGSVGGTVTTTWSTDVSAVALRLGALGALGERHWWASPESWRVDAWLEGAWYMMGDEVVLGALYRYTPTLTTPTRRVFLGGQDVGSPSHQSHHVGLELAWVEELSTHIELRYRLDITTFFGREPVWEHGLYFGYSVLLGGS